MLRLQVQIEHDSRNHLGSPSAGWQATFQGGVFTESGGNEHGFGQVSADVTRYIHLFYGRTLVLRGACQVLEPFGDRHIPFYYLSELGRRESIRGFVRGRFRDEDMVLGSLEYRFPILKRPREMWELPNVDALLFVDAGRVSQNVFSDNFDDMHVGIGGGLAVFTSKGRFIQFQIGKSKDGYRLYFVLN